MQIKTIKFFCHIICIANSQVQETHIYFLLDKLAPL